VRVPISPAVQADLAPTGAIRAAINYGNPLVGKNSDGEPCGVAPDIARALAQQVGVGIEFVGYHRPGHMVDAVSSGVWDIAFLAAEPGREEITFTAGYVETDATYLVPAGSPAHTVADLDREGVRIVVANKSAYDLFLSRTLKHARLIRADGVAASVERFVADNADAMAGIRPFLDRDAERRLLGSRVLEDRFTTIQQAIGVAKDRVAGAAYLRDFIEDIKASGLVARALEQYHVRGFCVAPLASRA